MTISFSKIADINLLTGAPLNKAQTDSNQTNQLACIDIGKLIKTAKGLDESFIWQKCLLTIINESPNIVALHYPSPELLQKFEPFFQKKYNIIKSADASCALLFNKQLFNQSNIDEDNIFFSCCLKNKKNQKIKIINLKSDNKINKNNFNNIANEKLSHYTAILIPFDNKENFQEIESTLSQLHFKRKLVDWTPRGAPEVSFWLWIRQNTVQAEVPKQEKHLQIETEKPKFQVVSNNYPKRHLCYKIAKIFAKFWKKLGALFCCRRAIH